MPYVFRKYRGYNPNEIQCWAQSTGINPDDFTFENIVARQGASKAGTSIPSPLARLELFDTAFELLAKQASPLIGETIYHQLVSQTLDVLQLLFRLKNNDIGQGRRVWFREWRVQENIALLQNRGARHPHNLLARSLDQIFNDKNNESFYGQENIFLIFYENRLLGGTSPLTLFFTTPNWSRYLEDGAITNPPRTPDGRALFGPDIRALHQRDIEFVKYIYKLSLQYAGQFGRARNFRSYVNKTIETHFPAFQNSEEFQRYRIAGNEALAEEYELLRTNIEGRFLTVNHIFFFHAKEENIRLKIERTSDFIVRASHNHNNSRGKEQTLPLPLVLVPGMNIPGDYVEPNVPWDTATEIPTYLYQGIPVYERELPLGKKTTGITYPFLTTDDFLERSILEMPFTLNTSRFHTGFRGDFKYLLPIKKEYFNYFTFADLERNLSIQLNGREIEVELRIPVRNTKGIPFISFRRTYKDKLIIPCRSNLAIFPFYRIDEPSFAKLNEYTILLAERNESLTNGALTFYRYGALTSGGAIFSRGEERSTRGDIQANNSTSTSVFYKLNQTFDYVELSYLDEERIPVSGLIVPKFGNVTFNRNNLNRGFVFAIDFGTSNTHVAYMQDNEPLPRAFDIGENDQQMVLLNAPGKDDAGKNRYDSYGQAAWTDLTLRREFVPAVAGPNETISFPFRTATCEIAAFNNVQEKSLFNHINIGYFIDKEDQKASSINYTTNLKWLLEQQGDISANRDRVSFFLRQLLIHIRAKTILNLGDPDQLKIVWSVPLSMQSGDRADLTDILREGFREVFNGTEAELLDPIPESVAPYFYLTESTDADFQNTANLVNVDIGGGTSDIMMFMESSGNREDRYLASSVRFGGTDLWGNGFESRSKDNGFIRNYFQFQEKNNIRPAVATPYLKKAMDDPNLSADDLVSLLFKYPEFQFADSIRRGKPDMLIIPYLHYSAIIYHVVQLIELKDYPLPRYLSFTGKGSQYIRLLCGGDAKQLETFTRLLIGAYSTKQLQKGFTIHLDKNPKEITANGSILFTRADAEKTSKYREDISAIHPGFDPASTTDLDPARQFKVEDIRKIDSRLNVAVLENVNGFLEKTLENKEIIRFLQGFKINALPEAHAHMKWEGDIFNGTGLVYDSYRRVLNSLDRLKEENELPESLFFYAFKDALYRLSKEISKI